MTFHKGVSASTLQASDNRNRAEIKRLLKQVGKLSKVSLVWDVLYVKLQQETNDTRLT